MSVLWAGNMRGPRIQTTVSRLVLLLLLLLSGPTSTVLCQEEDADSEAEIPEEETVVAEVAETEEAVPEEETVPEEEVVPEEETVPEEEVLPEEETTDPSENELDATAIPTGTAVPDTEAPEESGSGEIPFTEDETLGLLLIVVPVVLVVLIATIVAGVFIHRRISSKRHSETRKEDPYLDGSSTEKVPMPMFEEDVPSVLELEMDELDDWMRKDDLKQQA